MMFVKNPLIQNQKRCLIHFEEITMEYFMFLMILSLIYEFFFSEPVKTGDLPFRKTFVVKKRNCGRFHLCNCKRILHLNFDWIEKSGRYLYSTRMNKLVSYSYVWKIWCKKYDKRNHRKDAGKWFSDFFMIYGCNMYGSTQSLFWIISYWIWWWN
jgi:hypothetical protein